MILSVFRWFVNITLMSSSSLHVMNKKWQELYIFPYQSVFFFNFSEIDVYLLGMILEIKRMGMGWPSGCVTASFNNSGHVPCQQIVAHDRAVPSDAHIASH